MRPARKLTVLLLAVLALLSACKKKQPPVPQPQTQAPTVSVPPPQPTAPEPQPQPAPSEPQPAPPAETTSPATATRPKPKIHKKPATAKKTTPKPPEHKTVPNGGADTTGGQLSAGLPQGEAVHQRQTTAQLRINAEKNLGSLTRTLTGDEQSMVQQIRAYITQSRTAEKDGDTERAYNLALKGFLLSNELVKR